MTVKSLYFDQNEILQSIIDLHCNDGFEADLTFGNGVFYKKIKEPQFKFDLDPQRKDVIASCSGSLPIRSNCLNNLVFYPPFLTYVRSNRTGNGNMIMAKRFTGYWRYDELEKHYIETLAESARVLKTNGLMIFKCQDIIHNHKMHCTHANVILWAKNFGFELKDLFILAANHRLPSPNRKGKQQHARIFHSYFLVLKKC